MLCGVELSIRITMLGGGERREEQRRDLWRNICEKTLSALSSLSTSSLHSTFQPDVDQLFPSLQALHLALSH